MILLEDRADGSSLPLRRRGRARRRKYTIVKEILFKCRKSIVSLMKLLLYMALMGICFGLLSLHNPQIIKMSRTAAVTGLTFVVCGLFMTHIYGTYDIGKRKSRPIVHSLTLSVMFTDLLTFVMLIIMNMNEVNNNRMYPYLWEDLLLLLVALILQIFCIVLFTYGGHAIYFSFTDPEHCLIVTGGGDLRNLRRGIGKYKKQYKVEGTIELGDPNLYEAIEKVDTIFLNNVQEDDKNKIVSFCYQHMVNVFYTPEVVDVVNLHSRLAVLDDVSMIASEVKELSFEQRLIKRTMDIVVSTIGLIILSPILLVCAAAIKIGDGGTVLFRQNRVTEGGRIFTIYKFRTMIEHADQHLVTDHDSRITKVGHFLRKYRLDELPQLLNILKGDMSLVGPRPEMTEYVYVYSETLPEFLYRHRVKAGLTGYAQITGKYNTSSKDKLVMDLMYIESFSIWNDVKILFQTVLVLLRADESTAAFDDDEEAKRRGESE